VELQWRVKKKTHVIDRLNADVLIVQECEDPSQSPEAFRSWAGDYLWKGNNKNKGIGVFARNGHSITPLRWSRTFSITGLSGLSQASTWSTEDLKLFLPFLIDNAITTLAVWTKGSGNMAFGYIGQLWKFLQLHRGDLQTGRCIIAGDFNSNAIWDKPDQWWNHTEVVRELEAIGLHSLYHKQKNQAQGKEKDATFFLYRNPNKAYHIDYIFASEAIAGASRYGSGSVTEFLSVSDHIPIWLELRGWGQATGFTSISD